MEELKDFIEIHRNGSGEAIVLNKRWIEYAKRDINGHAILTVKGWYSDIVTEETYEQVVENLT